MNFSSSSASASSSSSSTTSQEKYDVFLSFRGEDTRYNFTSHLHAALNGKKIPTFIDDDLERGNEISPSLLKAIEESKISVVIISQDYPSSKWCLEELVKILECMKNRGQMVIPVFYRVDPSHVRNQTGSFEDVFARHEESLSVSKEKVQSWRAALKEVANLSGWHSTSTRPEAEAVKEIIEVIVKKLNQMSPNCYSRGLVGMESRIQEIESLLCLRSSNVRIVGIWGMGGLGKTTLARAIYDRIAPQFEICYFLSNAREQLQRCTLSELQNQLFSTLLEEQSTLNLQRSFIKDRLCRKKVLIVIDDADDSTQLQELLLESEPDYFGSGSRIIITSRDKQVLRNIARDKIYAMQKLKKHEALQLFSLKAFKQDNPTCRHCRLQAERVVKYAKGNPLALTVLGSALFGKREKDWKSALERLERNPNKKIDDVLRISYDGLDSEERSIFLDIACFFRGQDRDFVTKTLDGYYGSAHSVISTLIDRSVIMLSSDSSKLDLHDLLQEMGRKIVFEESKNPENRSRLWTPEDVCYVLNENRGTEAIEGISLDKSKATSEIRLKPDAFSRMCRLRFLKFYKSPGDFYRSPGDRHSKDKLQISRDGLQSLPNELRHLYWIDFPMKSLPPSFNPENLVVLHLRNSKVKKLWTGTQNLVKLKEIDLSGSKYLIGIPDLSKAIYIEKIDLSDCDNLEEVHSSIQYLNKLEFLNLWHCNKLRRLPRRIDSKVLKVLKLGSTRVKRCPEFQGNQLEDVFLYCPAIKNVTLTVLSILNSSRLVHLFVYRCRRLSILPSSFYKLKSLKSLDLLHCSKLESFPEILEPMYNIFKIDMSYCRNLKSFPNSISNLISLTYLNLAGTAIKQMPSSIEHLSQLDFLDLKDCKYLDSLPVSIRELPQLEEMYLTSCESLHSLPELPSSLKKLRAENCKSLERVTSYKNLGEATFANCLRLDQKSFQITDLRVPECIYKERYLLYPGSEVPGCFSSQSMGSSVTMQSSLNEKLFKDAAFCVVFEFKKSSDCVFEVRYREDNPEGRIRSGFPYSETPILTNTDHVLIWWDECIDLNNISGVVHSFDFYPVTHPKTGQKEIVKHCKVKRCGLHMLPRT
ncbi:leucine-rich repeat-containing protein, putative [Ricinus communis]|uniref:Leucine-rich repeat-containing protein, putative n=1 Tax=Ricinus communis TaxID=3988 RepID=B9RYD1_RICCO|nr:leucine-rich repeat-containing protein, putative [Ricinus communis]|eukprot:XP_002518715.1 TMV resistance protein N isoform X1 [Ricinus communis]